jgi:hypothetical protein
MDKFPVLFAVLCGGFFWIITLAGGVGLVLFSARSKKKAGLSLQWPSVRGTITTSEVRTGSSSDEDGNTSYSYYPQVKYTYAVAGKAYAGKQISFGGTQGYNSPNPVQPILARYPLNTTVPVYYNPEKPSEAVLERIAGGGSKIAMIFGIILIAISFVIGCVLLISLVRNFLV